MIKNRNIGKPFSAILIAAIMVLIAFSAMCTSASAQITEEQRNASIEMGLEWLALQQNPDGSWPGSHPVGKTAFAVLKFEHYAKEVRDPSFDDPFDPGYEYSDNITKGWDYLFENAYTVAIGTQPAGDPDSDGDGIGVYFGSTPLYETGIVMMALEASCNSSRVVTTGPLNGSTYEEVMVDMVDYIAWAQNEAGNGRGGWRYWANYSSSDNSVSQWPVLGLMSAEYGWNISAPAWVKTELRDQWLNYSQHTDGCFGYTGPGSYVGGPIATTASGLVQLTYCGVTTGDPRWEAGATCICNNWNDSSNIGNLYAMYGVMKAGMTAQPAIVWDFCGHEWQPPYDEWIIANQQIDGSWPHGVWGDDILETEWALLVLEKTVPPVPILIEIEKDFRYTNVEFVPMVWVEDHWEQQPAILGGLLPKDIVDPNPDFYDVRYVIKSKKGTVSSTNPGQLYGVINITGVGVTNVSVNDTFGTQFDVNPGKLGGGVEVIRVNATGYAEVLTNTPQVTDWSVDNDNNNVIVVINLSSPLEADEHLMIYIKFQTTLKHLVPQFPYSDFVNTAGVIVDKGDPIVTNATIEFYS